MKTKVTKPNFRVKHPYGYLIKSMLIGLILVFTSILSMATGIVNLTPKSTSEAAGNWSDSVTSTYNASSSTHGFASGTGTYSNPFVIKTIAQWRCFADFVYNWNGGYGYYFSLGADLDFSGGRMEDGIFSVGNTNSNENRSTVSTSISAPSGKTTSVSSSTKAKSFAGVFWGNGYRISNISAYNTVNFRLFASIAGISNVQTSTSVSTAPNYSSSYYATGVYDLVLYNIDLDFDASWAGAGDYYGILAGEARRAVISNVFVYFDEGGYEFHAPENVYIGGLVGGIEGCQIYGCKVSGFLMRGMSCVGGIVGGITSITNSYGNNYIINCHNAAGVYVSDAMGENFGGIIGYADSSSSSYLVIRNCWNTGVVTTWDTLGSSSTDGYTELLIDNASMAGIAGGTITGGNSSYVYILNSYNSGKVYASSYVGGSSTELNGYGIAGAYTKISNSSASNYKNYYLSGLQTNTTTSYESSLALSGFNTVSTSGLGLKNSYSGYYYSGITASGQQSGDIQCAYPTHSIFPVTSYTNVSGSTLSNVTVSKETGSVNYRQVGTTVAKKVYVTTGADSGVTVSKTNMTLHSSSSGVYNFTRLPSSTYASSVTFTGKAGYRLSITVNAYSTKGYVTQTSYTAVPTSTTTSASKTISFNKDDIREYFISVSSVRYLEGSGTASSPYLIKTADDLKAVYSYDEPGVYFALTNDITVPDTSYLNECNSIIRGLEGILDGRGYTIDLSAINYCSLFTYIDDNEALVYDLNIVAKLNMDAYTTDDLVDQASEAYETYTYSVGYVLAMWNYGIVDNVNLYVKDYANVRRFDWGDGYQYDVSCGLLVGTNSGTIKNCYVGPYNFPGMDYINSSGSGYYYDGIPALMLGMWQDVANGKVYFGGICGYNEGNVVGNSTSLHFSSDGFSADTLSGGYSVYVGHIVGYDERLSADKLLADNYAEGVNEWGTSYDDSDTDFCAGGIAGYIGGSYASSTNTVRNVTMLTLGSITSAYQVDSICGSTSVTGLAAHNFILKTSSLNGNIAFSTQHYTEIASGSATYASYGVEKDNFDPEYWIALSGEEGISGYLDNFDGEIFYPRSKKIYGSTVVSNNWTKNNGTTLNLTNTTTSIDISSALELGKLAQMINEGSEGYYRNLTTINITADIYMYGKYWTPIWNSLGLDHNLTIKGNNHTIYGLDSVGTNGGGLFYLVDQIKVQDLNFEDCMITAPIVFSQVTPNELNQAGSKGFICNFANLNDDGASVFDNIKFANCHIYGNHDNMWSDTVQFGFLCGNKESEYGVSVSNVLIQGEYCSNNTVFGSSIKSTADNPYKFKVGALFGEYRSNYFLESSTDITNVTIKDFEFYLGDPDSDTTPYSYIGGVIGDLNHGSYLGKVNIINLVIDDMLFDVAFEGDGAEFYLGGVIGFVGSNANADVYIEDSIIDNTIEIRRLVEYSDGNECVAFGGIVGYVTAGQVYVQQNDISVDIMATDDLLQKLNDNDDSTIHHIFGSQENTSVGNEDIAIAGIVGATNNSTTSIIDNNVIRVNSNLFDQSSYGSYGNGIGGTMVLVSEFMTVGQIGADYNLIIVTANSYERIYLSSIDYGREYTPNNTNKVYYTTGTSGTFYEADGDSFSSLTTAQLASLYTGASNTLATNDFYENKYISTSKKTYIDGDFTPFNVTYSGTTYYYTVYNVLENYTQIAAYNNISTSDTTVTVVRNGQYTLPYTAAGTSGSIYLVDGDTLTFNLNNTNYKFTASYDGYTSSTKSTDISTIVSESTSSYTHTVPSSMATNTYWTDGGSKFVAVQVDISQAARYFAVESSMTVNGATYVSTRGSYKVYKANIGASVTISKSGNTSGYSSSAGSYITGITQGTLNTSNSLTSTTSKTTSNSLSFTVSTSNTSSASTGSIVGFGYSSEAMYLHTITNNASLGSGSVYFTTSITGTSAYTSLYLKKGVTVTYHYPSTSGEWENPTVSRTGSVASSTSTSYNTTTGTCSSTVTYSKKTYTDNVVIEQEGTSAYGLASDISLNSDLSSTWGGYASNLTVYADNTDKKWSSIAGYNTIRRSTYITIGGKNLVGSFKTGSDNHTSYTPAYAKGDSITVTIHYPAGYKVGSVTYNNSTVSLTTNDTTNHTATFTYVNAGSDKVLIVSVVQDKWDDSANISAPSGTGTAEDTYKISTAKEYGWMVNKINAGTHSGKYFQITQDIDLSGKFISPITVDFTGTIDGTDSLHSIKNMKILGNTFNTSNDYTGIIKTLTSDGTLKNVIFVDPTVSTSRINSASTDTSTAYFIMSMQGTIENVGIRNDTAGTGFMSNNITFFDGFVSSSKITSFFNTSKVYINEGNIIEFNKANGVLSSMYSNVNINLLTTSSTPSSYSVFYDVQGADLDDYYSRTPIHKKLYGFTFESTPYIFYNTSESSGSNAGIYYESSCEHKNSYPNEFKGSNGVTSSKFYGNGGVATGNDSFREVLNYGWKDVSKWICTPDSSQIVNNIYRGQKYESDSNYPLLTMGKQNNMTVVTFAYKILKDGIDPAAAPETEWTNYKMEPYDQSWSMKYYRYWMTSTEVEFTIDVIRSSGYSNVEVPNYDVPLYLQSITAKSGFSIKFGDITGSNIARYDTKSYTISGYTFDTSGKAVILLTFSTSTSTFVADVNSVQSGLATGTHENQTVTASTSTSTNVVAKTYTYGLNSSYGPLVYESFAVENVTLLSGHSTTAVTKYIYKNGSTYYSYGSKQTSSSYTFVGRVDITPSNMRSGTITLYDLKEDIKITAKVYIAYAVSYSGLSSIATNTITTYCSTSAITTGTTSGISSATVRSSTDATESGTSSTYYVPVVNGTSKTYIGSVLDGNTKSYTWGTKKHNGTTDATNSNFTSTDKTAHSVASDTLMNTTSSVATLAYTYGPGEWTYTIKLNLLVWHVPSTINVRLWTEVDGYGDSFVFNKIETGAVSAGYKVQADYTGVQLRSTVTLDGYQYRVVWGDLKTGTAASNLTTGIDPTQDRTIVMNIIEQSYATINTSFTNTYDNKTFKSTYDNVLPTLTIEYDSTSLYVGGTKASYSSKTNLWTTDNNLGSYQIDYGAYIKYSTAGDNKIATATLASKTGNEYDTQDVYFKDIYSVSGVSEKEISSATKFENLTTSFAYQINVRTIDITIENQISSKHPNNYIGVTLSNNTSVATQSGKNWLYGSTTDNYVIYYKGLFNSSGTALDENSTDVRGYRLFYVVGGENIKVERGDGNQNSIQSITYSGGNNLFFTYNDDTTSKLKGRAGVIRENSSFSFTYYPYVTMSVNIDKTTTSTYAGNNDCLNATVSVGGMIPKTDTSTGYYIENSSLSYTNTNNGTFETPVYICLTVTVPDITGWTFNGWYLGTTQITDNKDVYKGTTTEKIGVYKLSTTSSGNKRVYTLKFPCEVNDTDTLVGTTYNIKFTENTYTITAKSYLTSGGIRSEENSIAYKYLSQCSTSSYGNPAIVAGSATSTSAIEEYIAGYFGYYQITYLSKDTNTYEYISGNANINKQTSTYASTGEFKQWHTITVSSSATYTTTGYSGCKVTNSNNSVFTIKTSDAATAVQIATITVTNLTSKGNVLKVLEGNTITVSYTINTDKFNGTVKVSGSAISSGVTKTITADTSISGTFAENVYTLKFYKNTASTTQVGSSVTLGSLGTYTIADTYKATPGSEYKFEKWTTNAGSKLTFGNATQASTTITGTGANNTYNVYANWRRAYYHTFTNGGVSTEQKTSGNNNVGGKITTFTVNSDKTQVTLAVTASTGYDFTGYTVTNGTASGNVITRSGLNYTITSNTITYGGKTYYVSGSILYQDQAHLIHFSAFDYVISGSTVTIYDKTNVTVVANFVEKTYGIKITQPSGGKITITSHTSSVPNIQYDSNSRPTQITVGYFSSLGLKYENTNSAYRFNAWSYTSSNYTSKNVNGTTATFGANIIGADTISVTEYSQREIVINAPLVRYKSSSTSEDQTVTLTSVVNNNGTITLTYSGYYTITIKSNGTAIETKGSGTSTRMYIITNDDEIVTTFTVTANTKFYSFTTPSGKGVTTSSSADGYSISGSVDATMTVKFKANTTCLPNASNTITWRGVLKDDIKAEDHTNTSSNAKVYVASQNQASVKVAEGESVTIIATDYTATNAEKTAYKFSHWTFKATGATTESTCNWITTTNKENSFVVYADRAGTYTAHYIYAYKVSTALKTTNNGTSFSDGIGTTPTLTQTSSNYSDSTYLAGTAVTLTAKIDSNYAYYGWYLYNGTKYTLITASTTGVTTVNDTTLTFTVGGEGCCNRTYSGIDLENNTIVYAGIKLYAYDFGGISGGPSATYTVTGTGVYRVTGGTLSGTTATMTATGGTFMTVYIKDGTSATFTVSGLASGTRTNGVLYYKSNVNQGSISSITLTNGGLGGLKFELTANETTTGKYETQYQTIYSVINSSSATITDTHVTNNHTDTVANSIISISANTAGTAGTGVTYYDLNTEITLSASIPDGHQFVNWVVNGTKCTPQTYSFTLTSSITSIALYIKEIEYEVSTQTNLSVPAGFNTTITSATTWTSDSFGTFTYTTDSSTTKIGYFGTITIGTFTSGNKLYINSGKAYYDSECKHAVNTNNYSISGSTLTYLGSTYSISNNVATIWNLYINPTYKVTTGTGTLSGSKITDVRSNITITCTVEMQGKLKNKGLNRKDSTVITTVSEKTEKVINTVTYTAEDKTGYVFKGWAVYNNSGERLTATGDYYSTEKTITVQLTEDNNGYTYVAEYNPTFSLTVSANDFGQEGSIGSITATIGGKTKDAISEKTTYTNIEWGTEITLKATAKTGYRTNNWTGTNGDNKLESGLDTLTFNIDGTATATHNFLKQYKITITHNKECTTSGGTWTIQEYRKGDDNNYSWSNVTDTNFVNATGSKTFTLADAGTQYRVVVTTSKDHYITLSTTGTTSTISNSGVYSMTGTLTSSVTFNAMTADSTVTIKHTGLNYVYVTTSPEDLKNTVTVDADYLNTKKSGTGTLGTSSSPIALKNDGSTTITTTAVSGYDNPTWNDGTTKSLTYTLTNDTVGTTYHVTIKYPDNSGKTINLTVVGYTGEFEYASIVSNSAQNTQTLNHAYQVNGLSLKNGLTALRFSGFDSTIVSSVTVSDGTNTYTGTSSVDYTIPTGSDTINLTLTVTNNTWIDTNNFTAPSGTGVATDPYKIANASNFAWISYQSANGENFAGKYFVQTGNIDLSGHLWVPIQNFNGVFVGSHSYSIQNITTSDEQYNFADTTLNAKTLYYSMGLFANSNGGVFRTLKIADYNNVSWVTNVSKLESHAVLLAKGTDVVIDGIILDNVVLESNTFNDNSGLLVASLTGGKISNVEYGEGSKYIYNTFETSGVSISTLSTFGYNAGLVGETKAGTKTYVDSNGNSVNVVIENINMYDGIISKINSGNAPSFIVGINTSTLSLNNIYVDNTNTTSSNAIYYSALFNTNSGTITAQNIVINSKSSSMSTYDTMIGANTGTLTCTDVYGTYKFSTSSDTYSGYTKTSTFTSAFNTLYNKGGNVWYKGGMDIFGEYTTSSSEDDVTITDGVIQLSGNITMAKFKNALNALSNNSSVTKVELLSDIDFGGATLDTSYSIPAGKTFDGHGYTISGIKAVRRVAGSESTVSGIFNTISGTLKRVVFNNIYVYVLPTSTTSVPYQHVAIIGGYNSGITMERVTVQNSRLNVAYDGIVGKDTSKPTIAVFGASVLSSTNGSIKYVDTVSTKITVSNYGTSSTEAFKIGGLVGYVTVPVDNVQIGTDIIVDSNSTGHLVSGVAGYSSSTMNNVAVKGNITATNSNVYTISGAGSTKITNAYASGTFAPKATALYANCSTASNVYISANSSSASGTKSDAQMKTQSTYSGFNFDGTSSGDTLTWYMNTYPTFTVPSNHMKVEVTLSGDGSTSGANSITLDKRTSSEDSHGIVTLNSAGSISRLYSANSGDYNYVLKVVVANGFTINQSSCTNENNETVDLNEIMSSSIDEVGYTIYTINASYSKYDLKFNFEIVRNDYTVDITVVGHGTVTGAGSYKTGDSVTLTATPSASTSHTQHHFIGWYSGSIQVSTSTTYTFTAVEGTAGTYQAKFCSDASGNCNFKATASMSSGSQSTVSPTDTGWVVGGGTGSAYEKTFTVALADGEEITSITRDGTQIYSKVGGVTNTSLYTATITSSNFTLKVLINSTTKGSYIFTTGATSQVVTINVANVGGSTRSETDAYSAHGIINLSTSSTSSTITANATTGTISVIYGQTLTISFMSNIRYKLGSVNTTISGGNTSFTTTTSTVGGYTRYTYSYTTNAITSDTTITLNLVKDRWVDFTSSTSYTAGHSTEFITANGGTASNEISSSSATFGSDKKYKGTEANPFVISTASQLARVSYLVNINASFMTYKGSTLTQVYYKDACYKITADIDLNNYFWTPINMRGSENIKMSIVSEQQSVISNMYLRYDKEEYALDSSSSIYDNLAFIMGDAGMITGITFDGAVVYNSSATGYSGVVSTNSSSMLNFITVKNSNIYTASYAGVVVGRANIMSLLNYINSVSNTITTISDLTVGPGMYAGGIVGCVTNAASLDLDTLPTVASLGINNVSVSGLKIKNTTSYGLYAGGIVGYSDSVVIIDSIVHGITTEGNNIILSNISTYDMYGNDYQNVWSASSANFNSLYRDDPVNTYSGTPNLSTLGFSSDTWYVSNGVALTKGYSTGTNSIGNIADVTTGGFAGGTGTKEDPYLISNATQFRYLQYLVNSGNTTYNSSTKYYKITADLDLGGGISTVLGIGLDNLAVENSSKRFKANLDGDFHTISNMIVFDAYNNNYLGFVAYSDKDSSIKNLNLDNYTIIAKANVGGLVGNGTNGVNIDNISITNAIIVGSSLYTGGIVADVINNSQNAIIKNAAFDGTIISDASKAIGGIVGYVNYNNNVDYNIYIQNCHSDGTIISSGRNISLSIGGILGQSENTTFEVITYISDCYNNMSLLSGAGMMGGIVGYTSNTEIKNCYNNGELIISSCQIVSSNISSYYNSNTDYNNGSMSISTNTVAFYGEIVGRNFNNTINTTIIIDSKFNESKKIVVTNNSSTGLLLPYGDRNILGHTPNGYGMYTNSSISGSYTDAIGSAEMKNADAMTEIGNFSSWDRYTIWYFDGTNLPVHRWNTQNRQYFEGVGLDISQDGKSIIVENGKITFADEVVPIKDSDGRVYVYVSGSSLNMTFVPDENYALESAQIRDYYGTTYSALTGTSVSFGSYNDGASFKALKVSYVNSKFTITVNTSLSRGNGIAVGEYETLHIVILNTTTNEAYTCTLDDGTYVFDELTAGTYYVAVYTSMFFNVSNISCTTEGITFGEVQFYRTLVLSNSTSANAIINITANKTVDAWIYSKVEIGA